jgi:hypothetical protein
MTSAAALTSLTFVGPDTPPDEIVAADVEELRALHRLLAGQASQSALAKHLADAIERALAEDSELVLITGAPGCAGDSRRSSSR